MEEFKCPILQQKGRARTITFNDEKQVQGISEYDVLEPAQATVAVQAMMGLCEACDYFNDCVPVPTASKAFRHSPGIKIEPGCHPDQEILSTMEHSGYVHLLNQEEKARFPWWKKL